MDSHNEKHNIRNARSGMACVMAGRNVIYNYSVAWAYLREMVNINSE